MFFKKIFFFLFFISSVSIPGYYFYQRSKSKKEEEVQEEAEKEETEEEEVALVEINGWLDWFLLTIIIVIFLVSFLFYLGLTHLPTHLNKYLLDSFQYFLMIRDISVFSLESIIHDNIKTVQDVAKFDEKYIVVKKETSAKKVKKDLLQHYVDKVNYFCLLRYCLENNKFYLSNAFCGYLFQKGSLKFYSPSKYLSFSVTIIFLSYNLYFFMKSFWQVGFQRTFENLHWLDLFSITKVFRRNSIIKKIAFLVVVLFSWLILITAFLWSFSIKTSEELDKYCSDNKLKNYLSENEIPKEVKKTLDEILQIKLLQENLI